MKLWEEGFIVIVSGYKLTMIDYTQRRQPTLQLHNQPMFFVLLHNVNTDAEAHTPHTVQSPPPTATMIAIEGKNAHRWD
jgi:hypothetical protein